MAYSVVAHTSQALGPTGGTTSGIDTTGADLIAIVCVSYATNPEPTLSDSKGNTWTPRTQQLSTNCRIRIYYCQSPIVGSGHTFTYTHLPDGSYCSIAILALSGSTSTPYDVENGATTGGATSLATGSVTPSVDNEILITGIGFNASNTMSIDSSFTIQDQTNYVGANNFGIALAYLIETTATAKNPSWSWSSSTDAAAAIATFKAAAGGGGSTRGLFRVPSLTGLGSGGSFFSNPLA